MITLKKTYSYRVFLAFSIFLFFFFLFLLLKHKDKNNKCNFLFKNLIFDIPKILQKHYFGTVWHYLCFQKYPENTINIGKTVKIDLDQFFDTRLGPVLTLETPNLGPVFNSTACIYIYIYVCTY